MSITMRVLAADPCATVNVGCIGRRRADGHIIKTVAIDIAKAGDRAACSVACTNAIQARALQAIEVRKIERVDIEQSLGSAKDQISRALAVVLAIWIGIVGADNRIGKAVAVDVARLGHRQSCVI